MSCGFWLKEQSHINKDKIAIMTDDQSLTFEELYTQVYQLAQCMTSLRQNRVGLYIKNDLDSIILIHACWLVLKR